MSNGSGKTQKHEKIDISAQTNTSFGNQSTGSEQEDCGKVKDTPKTVWVRGVTCRYPTCRIGLHDHCHEIDVRQIFPRQSSTLITGTRDIISHPVLGRSLRTFQRLSRRGRGSTLKAQQFLSEFCPDVYVDYDALKATKMVQDHIQEASDFIRLIND